MRSMTFPNIPLEHWNELKISVSKDTGMVLSGNEGKGQVHGIDYSYSYDPATQVLSVEEDSRFAFVANKIHDGIEQALSQS